jgi:hypothetical protein
MTVWLAIALCVAVLLGLGAFDVERLADEGCGPLAQAPCVRVLFLGNSYTYVNDLPGMFRHLAHAGGRNVATGMVANGGETLAQHAASADSLAAITGSHWQYVVLQEQSEIPALASAWQSEMYPAARSLVDAVRGTGATPVLLETWAHQAGLATAGLDNAGMQAAIDAGYETLGNDLGVTVVPAGQAWAAARRIDPTIVLWQSDGSHPSVAGTYLVACVVYARLFGASPVGLGDTEGLPLDVALSLQAVAARW